MNVKNKKGSITLFVLVGVLFMSSFLLISFGYNVNKSKIAKEQYEIMKDTYSNHESDAEAYNTVYTELINKNKTQLTETSSYVSAIELTNSFEEKASNYRIYGSIPALGKYNSTNGKYEIKIEVSNIDGSKTGSYTIYLSAPLKASGTKVDYIDYKNQKVVRQVDSQTEELIYIPYIDIYEELTMLKVTNGVPSKMIIEYTGYEFNS